MAATSPAAATSSGLQWLWIVLAVAAAALIVALVARSRSRGRAVGDWRSRARDPYAQGIVLHDRLGAELARAEVSGDAIGQILTDLDQVSQKLNSLTVDAPDDQMRQPLGELLMTLGTLRSALEQLRQGGDPATVQAASTLARGRLADFDTALRSFRTAVWSQSPAG